MFFRKKVVPKQNKTFLYSVVEFIFLLSLVFLIRTFGFGLYQVPTGSMETTMLVGERFFADKLSYRFRNPRNNEIIAFNDPSYPYSKNKAKRLFEEYIWGASNWTKRVIGIPGDHVRGVIEDGKPVVYLNGQKLDEPYVNSYPLIHKWSQDPRGLRDQERKKLIQEGVNVHAHMGQVDRYINNKLAKYIDWRSYDATVPYDQQPFYKINPAYLIRDAEGQIELKAPYEPIESTDKYASKPHTPGRYWGNGDEFDVILKDGEYWCMGDNRRGSWDCRFFGPINRRLIHGRILFRIISIDSTDSWLIFDLLSQPVEFWSRIRWGRFLQVIR
jgi:signal peptidase I